MLAMTASKTDRCRSSSVDSATMDKQEGSSEALGGHSGLSALIEAATSQFGHLAEDKRPSEDMLDHPATTPTMVPEADPRKQSFPELLMTLAVDPSHKDVIAFLPDGRFFAIRSEAFASSLMLDYFAVSTFTEFLDLLNDWGFSLIVQESGIAVLRHPKFIHGDFERCTLIKFGESPDTARLDALPERARLDLVADSGKRRLSPSFLARRESESSVSSQKIKRRESESEETQYTQVSRSDELRSVALSITTEKLSLKQADNALIDRAVESCTQTIVTDAIETLLRDESHTKSTYLKHEKELSISSLPGVIPISKQLFADPDKECPVDKEKPPAAVSPPPPLAPPSSSSTSPKSTTAPLAVTVSGDAGEDEGDQPPVEAACEVPRAVTT